MVPEDLPERGSRAVTLLPSRGEQRVRERFAGPGEGPSASLNLGSLLFLLGSLRRGERRILTALLRLLGRGCRRDCPFGVIPRRTFLFTLEPVTFPRAQLRQVRGVNLVFLNLDGNLLVEVVLADEIVHIDKLGDVQRAGPFLLLDARIPVRLDGHAEPLLQRLLGQSQPLLLAQFGVVRGGRVKVSHLGREQRRCCVQNPDDVELVKFEVSIGVRIVIPRVSLGLSLDRRELLGTRGGHLRRDTLEPGDVRDCGVVDALAYERHSLGGGDASLPLLVLQKPTNLE